MAINKVQVGLIALVNAVSAIYSYICLSDYGTVFHSFETETSKIWLALILMSVMAGLVAIYFTLMTLYGVICTCLTGDTSNQKPSFSLCGCFSLIIYILTYGWGWMLYLNISDSVKNLIIWKAFEFQIYLPVIIIGLSISFFIFRLIFTSNKKKHDSYIRHEENERDNLV